MSQVDEAFAFAARGEIDRFGQIIEESSGRIARHDLGMAGVDRDHELARLQQATAERAYFVKKLAELESETPNQFLASIPDLIQSEEA